MRICGYELTYPRVVFVVVLITTLTTVAVGVGTSSAAYGSYNYDWDGTSDIRPVAADAGSDIEIVRSEAGYRQANAQSATALILEPTDSYSEPESDAVASFLDRGGTVVIAAEGDSEANQLLTTLGVSSQFDGRALRDEQRHYGNPALPIGTSVREATVTSNVSQLTVNHGTTVSASEDATVLINSSAFSYIDANANDELDPAEPIQEHPIVVREAVENGSVVLVSDGSVFINGMLDRTDNRQFAANVLGRSDTLLIDHQRRPAIPEAVAFVLTIINSPLRLLLLALSVISVIGIVWWRVTADRDDGSTPISAEQYSEIIEGEVIKRQPSWDDERVERVTEEATTDEA